MVQQQVVRMADVDELAVVARHRFEPAIGRLDEDLRLVSGRTQHALDAEHLVADRVAVPERREDLMDPDHERSTGRGQFLCPRHGRAPGQLRHHLLARRQVAAPPREPRWQRLKRATAPVLS